MNNEEVKACALFDVEVNEFESEKNLRRLLNNALTENNQESVIEICNLIHNNNNIENKILWETKE